MHGPSASSHLRWFLFWQLPGYRRPEHRDVCYRLMHCGVFVWSIWHSVLFCIQPANGYCEIIDEALSVAVGKEQV